MSDLKHTQQVIEQAINRAAEKAQKSEYDRTVCIAAVMAARQTFQSVPLEGSKADYFQAVLTALTTLQQSYHDPDGEYTNGTAMIGTVIEEVLAVAPPAS